MDPGTSRLLGSARTAQPKVFSFSPGGKCSWDFNNKKENQLKFSPWKEARVCKKRAKLRESLLYQYKETEVRPAEGDRKIVIPRTLARAKCHLRDCLLPSFGPSKGWPCWFLDSGKKESMSKIMAHVRTRNPPLCMGKDNNSKEREQILNLLLCQIENFSQI